MATVDHPTEADLQTLSRQLGRPVRDVVAIGARCQGCGSPLVATTAPRLSNGIPFPTTFYLTHPLATTAVSRLEATGIMAEMTDELAHNRHLADQYRAAHENYLAERDRIGQIAGVGEVPEIEGISAGGMPERVKCLHVLAAHSLSVGPGVNPLGDRVLDLISEEFSAQRCRCEHGWDDASVAPRQDLSRHVRRLNRQGRTNPIQHRRVSADEATAVAAIDCGTNSLRLLVARPVADPDTGAKLVELHREMQVVRLGEGVDQSGEFAPQALERTFATCRDYAEVIEHHRAETVRFVATSASRDVSNRDAFIAGVRQALNVTPEVVSGAEEAHLTFSGALSALDDAQLQAIAVERENPDQSVRVMVVDLGGGSTECVVGEVGFASGHREITLVGSVSENIGCVRFTERYLRSDPPTAEEIAVADCELNEVFTRVHEELDFSTIDAVIGVAGTVTTLTAAALGLKEYDADAIHGAQLDRETLKATAATLLHSTRAERANLGFMHPGRADVIGAGALIWSTLLQIVHDATGGELAAIITSEHDILDGIALSLIGPNDSRVQDS